MGYYTKYTLKVENGGKEDHVNGIREILEYGNPFEKDCKWYHHEGDMRGYFLSFPETLFWLTGYGDRRCDIWVKHFKNGKMQRCDADFRFEEYDEKKLK